MFQEKKLKARNQVPAKMSEILADFNSEHVLPCSGEDWKRTEETAKHYTKHKQMGPRSTFIQIIKNIKQTLLEKNHTIAKNSNGTQMHFIR